MFDKQLFDLPGTRRAMALLLVAQLACAVCTVGQVVTLSQALAGLWGGLPLNAAWPLLGAFAACFLGRQVVGTARDAALDRFARRQADALRGQLLERVFGTKSKAVGRMGSAATCTQVIEGADAVERYLRLILPKTVGLVAVTVPLLAAAFALDWVSGLILLVCFPTIIMFMVLLGRAAADRARAQHTRYETLANHFIDTLRGLPTLHAFGAQKRAEADVFQSSERFREATVDTLRVATLSGAVLDLVATLGVAAVAIMLAFRLMDGSLALWVGLSCLMLAPEFFQPIRAFGSDYHASLDGRNALAAALAFLRDESDAEAAAGAEAATGAEAAAGAASDASNDDNTFQWTARSTIELRGVRFSHPDGTEALAPVSCTLRGFQNVGVVGPSGSGKSTLASLLAGFDAPTGGSFALDGAPRDSLQHDAWQRQVAYIPQHPTLFHGTLRDNLTFYAPQAGDEAVQRAVDAVGLRQLVDELPRGLDTVVGAAGRDLSGGQAHRVALARAVLCPERRILVLDEPTAHLDLETELDLKERLAPLMEGRLVILATHRLHWLDQMDAVVDLSAEGAADAEAAGEAVAVAAAPAEAAPAAAAAPAGTPPLRTPRAAAARPIALGFAAAVCAVGLMFTAGYLISRTAQPGMTLFYIMTPVALVQVFGIGKPLARYFERLAAHDWVFALTSRLRLRLFRAIERRERAGRRGQLGEYLGLLAADIGHLQNLYLRVAFPACVAALLLVAACIACAAASPVLAAGTAAALVCIGIVFPLVSWMLNRTRVQQASQDAHRLYTQLADDVMGAVDWVLSGRGAARAAQLAQAARECAGLAARTRRVQRGLALAVACVTCAGALFVIWWAAGAFGGQAASDAACLIAAFAIAWFSLAEQFAALPELAPDAASHAESLRRLRTLESDDEAVEAVPGPDARTVQPPAPHPPSSAPSAAPAIQLEGVSFAYPGARSKALDGVTLHISPGEKLAILGPSGSGKSTLAALLQGRVVPDMGKVLLDGTPTAQLRAQMPRLLGLVQQKPYLFNRTLRENLALAAPDASDQQLLDALAAVGLAERTDALPQGLDTILDEAGANFSGGEAHRIAIARVLLARTPAVLLDEPMAGLDPATEHALLDTLLRAFQGRTLIAITHHLQDIERFDRVVFLDAGRIVLEGTPAQLAAESPRFRALQAADR